MNIRHSMRVLFALDDERLKGNRLVPVPALSDCADGDRGSLRELLGRMAEAGWIELTKDEAVQRVSLKKELEDISMYDIVALNEGPEMKKDMEWIFRDVSVMDIKSAKEEFEESPRDREYAERMLADLWRRIREREAMAQKQTPAN